MEIGFQLCDAAFRGKVDQLKVLVETKNADVNSRGYDKRTPLHIAAAEGHQLVVEYLVSKGADVNAKDRLGRTPLDDARFSSFEGIVNFLTKSGAESPDALGTSAKANTKHQSTMLDRQLTSALRHVLPLLTEKSKSEYVEVWYPADKEGKELACSHLWYCDASHIDKVIGLRKVSEDLRAGLEDGVLHDVLEKKQPVAFDKLERLAIRDRPARLEALQQSGLRWGVALPVKVSLGGAEGRDTSAVLVFASFVPPAGPLPTAAALQELSQLAHRAVSSAWRDPAAPASRFDEQKKEVYQLIVQEGVFNAALIYEEVEYYYGALGLSEYYFSHFPPHVIAKHIHTFLAAKKYAVVSGSPEDIRINAEDVQSDFFMCPNRYEHTIKIDQRIEKALEGTSGTGELRRLTFITSTGPIVAGGTTPLALYFLDPVSFTGTGESTAASAVAAATAVAAEGGAATSAAATAAAASSGAASSGANLPRSNSVEDIWSISTGKFLVSKSATVRERYSELLNKAMGTLAPVIRFYEKEEGTTLLIALRRDSSPGYFAALSELLNFNVIDCSKKFVEQFANGYIVIHITLNESPNELADFLNQVSLMALVPQTVIRPLLLRGQLSTNEMVYAYVVFRFAYYFLKPSNDEYLMLYEALKDDPVNAGRLIRLRKVMQKEFLSESRIEETIVKHTDVLKQLYADFASKFKPKTPGTAAAGPPGSAQAAAVAALVGAPGGPGKGLQRVKTWKPTSEWDPRQIPSLIKKSVTTELDEQILTCFLVFNQHLLKTNFFKQNKSALSFRLDPKFMAGRDIRAVPYGLFFVLGRDFRGFHVRFRDVARGGIRLVRSASQQQHVRNKETLFDENYNLAFTQQMKNKDIPEGGSKGTVLPSFELKGNPEVCFKKYIDSLLDLLLADPDVVDYYGREEILFMGPDEGTADFMDWAALHARSRGARFWKAFTTGKSTGLGGIPHDLFGMTTRGIHEFKLGILRKRGLDERRISKFQTGGPDGDLGSNEIRISLDMTRAVVDGSGVLCDPKGIDREELTRLAKTRVMVNKFDRTKLSPQGFLVLVEDRDVTLPDGSKVESGLAFRNEFHLMHYAAAELFVPCGGRPEAVNINNYQRLIEKDGTPRFKYVVEGANLFFTQDARLALEKAGCVIFKDASANKGGVTSSSLEVLAALALSDEEFSAHMMVTGSHTPAFYTKYVEHVKNVIALNARLEFECIWREHEASNVPYVILTDKVSEKINELENTISRSPLWNQIHLRKRILTEALPPLLVELLGLEKILARVPEAYLRAIFGGFLAARYVYKHGLNANEFAFFEYMQQYLVDS